MIEKERKKEEKKLLQLDPLTNNLFEIPNFFFFNCRRQTCYGVRAGRKLTYHQTE